MPEFIIMQHKSKKDMWRQESGATKVVNIGDALLKKAVTIVREMAKETNDIVSASTGNQYVYAVVSDYTSGERKMYEYYAPKDPNKIFNKLASDLYYNTDATLYNTYRRPNWLDSIDIVDGKKQKFICHGSLGETSTIYLDSIMSNITYRRIAESLNEILDVFGDAIGPIKAIHLVDCRGKVSPHILEKRLWCTREISEEEWICVMSSKLYLGDNNVYAV